MTNWIHPDVDKDWHFSCNSKGWTSNIHGQMWLKECFEPATQLKSNGRKRLLLCDGHDSHISAQFVSFCIDHNIILFLLPPHSSHLLQPLDVGVFGPVKRGMAYALSRLYATEIARLQKAEWLECYIRARAEGLTSQNILGGWRGTGLSPLNPHRVLRTISGSTPSPSPVMQPTEMTPSLLLTSSPPDSTILRSTNSSFTELLRTSNIPTPARIHGRRISNIAERLQAENTILKRENAQLRSITNKRKERASGKRLVLKGKVLVSTEEVRQKLIEAEEAIKTSRSKMQRKNRPEPLRRNQRVEDDSSDESAEEVEEIQDCIEVILR
jgi:hypothetical protein